MKIQIRQCIVDEIIRMSRDELLETTTAITRISRKLRDRFPEMKREQRRQAAAKLVHEYQSKRSNQT